MKSGGNRKPARTGGPQVAKGDHEKPDERMHYDP